jgi:DNA-binding HxlR family transcriptional regulator
MDKNCPVLYSANLLGKRWTIMIILEIYKGENKWKRYIEIKNKMPQLTPKILSTRLKELQKEGIIDKKIDSSTVPIKSEYSLTKKGEGFIKIIHDMRDWSMKNSSRKCNVKDCRQCEC